MRPCGRTRPGEFPVTLDRPLRVAIIGAGPAGTYAADIFAVERV